MRPAPALRLSLRLAFRAWASDWRLALCLSAGVAAVLAPLLILAALKHGLVDDLKHELTRNPAMREVRPLAHGSYSADFFNALRADPRVDFIMPEPRFIAASLQLRNPRDSAKPLHRADLVATGRGDPVLAGLPPPSGFRRVALSASSAALLGLASGDPVQAVVSRIRPDGDYEQVSMPMVVSSVAPADRSNRDAAFLPVEAVFGIAAWQERSDVARLVAASPLAAPAPSFRLYARDIYSVEPLRRRLAELEIPAETHAAQIESVRRLDLGLDLLFALVGASSAIGGVLALGASLWADVERKLPMLARLQLMGFPQFALCAFPATQALASAAAGSALALALFGLASLLIHGLAVAGLAGAADLPLPVAALAVLITLSAAAAAAAVAAARILRIDPAEGVWNG